ncbi:hypothetical protein ACFPIJ_37835 [Dactylosporangium cerinum]|uniref:Uncharacterized protein n=1 Tax=Dactylosporangium cerinum TaxID=1434730 RepID=A0ABV9W8W1_9ACTN
MPFSARLTNRRIIATVIVGMLFGAALALLAGIGGASGAGAATGFRADGGEPVVVVSTTPPAHPDGWGWP